MLNKNICSGETFFKSLQIICFEQPLKFEIVILVWISNVVKCLTAFNYTFS